MPLNRPLMTYSCHRLIDLVDLVDLCLAMIKIDKIELLPELGWLQINPDMRRVKYFCPWTISAWTNRIWDWNKIWGQAFNCNRTTGLLWSGARGALNKSIHKLNEFQNVESEYCLAVMLIPGHVLSPFKGIWFHTTYHM
jgi:hypothetical protein